MPNVYKTYRYTDENHNVVDKQYRYQPYMAGLEEFDNYAKRTLHISSPFSKEGMEAVLGHPEVAQAYIDIVKKNFKGAEEYAEAVQLSSQRAFAETHNAFGDRMYLDRTPVLGAEGYAASNPSQTFNPFIGLTPLVTASTLATSRSLENFLIFNSEGPVIARQYSVRYVQDGLEGKQYILPFAIRNGELSGLLTLPECEPKVTSENSGKFFELDVTSSLKRTFCKVSTGNIMENAVLPDGTAVNPRKYALQKQCSIDYVCLKINGNRVAVKTNINRVMKEGSISERAFSSIVTHSYTDSTTKKLVTVKVRVMAVIDLDTGNYQVLSDGQNILEGVHFALKLSNLANEFSTYMAGNLTYNMSYDIEDTRAGSAIMIPEVMADFNVAGTGVTWMSFMTDMMTKDFSAMRDIDLENYVEEVYQYDPAQMELAIKVGGFKFADSFPLISRQPGGTDDILAPVRTAFKQYVTKVFTISETYLNFEKNIEKMWILTAYEPDLAFLPDITWTNSSAAPGEAAADNSRFGFAIEDGYGWSDSLGRRVRIVGNTDVRWAGRPIRAVLKSMSMEAPTLLYTPYMFRVQTAISPEMTNRSAIEYLARQSMHACSLVQCRFTLDGNDLGIWKNNAAFAAGLEPKYSHDATETTPGHMSSEMPNTLPDYITAAAESTETADSSSASSGTTETSGTSE